jgi:Phosphate-selective porin O and P
LLRTACLSTIVITLPAAAYAQSPPAKAEPDTLEAPEVPGSSETQPAPSPPKREPSAPPVQAPVAPPPPPPPPPPPIVAPPIEAPPIEVPPPAPAVEPPPPPAPPVELSPPAAVAEAPAIPPAAEQPLAGFSDGTAYLRSRDNEFILFPTGRLQIDTYLFQSKNKNPNNSGLIRRARMELTGWVGRWVYFSIAGDYAAGAPVTAAAPTAQSNLATTDVYVAIAPWRNYFILQVGQFDAPFTLENRTSDKYFDFMERSITVRAFGIPDNKEIGAVVFGYSDDRRVHYSLGVVNGDSQNFRNVDSNFDGIGRAWIAPFSFAGPGKLHDVEIGASFWRGDRANTLALPAQTTQSGFTFLSFNSYNASVRGATLPVQLRQVGLLTAAAGELNAPVDHTFGVRGEFVWKHSSLSEDNVTNSAAPVILGGANLKGWSAYGEIWFWAIGDDRIIGDQQGLEPLSRFKKFGVTPIRDGLMLAFRVERLHEELTLESDAAGLNLKDPSVGTTSVTSYELGINYWHSKRYRATFNYVYNHIEGDTLQVAALKNPNVQELTFRFAIAL